MKKSSSPLPPLQEGQIWQMNETNLQIGSVGKLLVHYKIFKGNAKRPPTSLSGKGVVEKYLKKNKAILVQAQP